MTFVAFDIALAVATSVASETVTAAEPLTSAFVGEASKAALI